MSSHSARAIGGTNDSRTQNSRRQDSDVVRASARMRMAQAWVHAGRHAAAARLLREVAAALERRRAWAHASRAWLGLGQLLLERGRAVDACGAFEAARVAARDGVDADAEASVAAWDAPVWLAMARTDAGQLADAEALAGAAMERAPSGAHAAWAASVLTDVRLWQRRWADASALSRPCSGIEVLAHVPQAMVTAASVRRLLLDGRTFEAGQRAAASLGEASARDRAIDAAGRVATGSAGHGGTGDGGPDPDDIRQSWMASVIVSTAHLRVLCASGDLDLARTRLDAVLAQARHARVPVQAMRARMIFAAALGRAGRMGEAERQWHRLQRAAVALPPLLREAVALRSVTSAGQAPVAVTVDEAGVPATWRHASTTMSSTTPSLTPCVPPVDVPSADSLPLSPPVSIVSNGLPHGEADDHEAIRALLTSVATGLRASRLDVCAPGLSRTSAPCLVTVGCGPQPTVAALVCGRGGPVGPLAHRDGWEAGVPVWFGTRRIAVVVGRWDGVRPGDAALDVMALAAAVGAPRVAAMISRATDAVVADRAVPELIGSSAAIQAVRDAVARAARAPFAVLIEGESGVGKELAARALHRLSPRHACPFGDVNCAALPDELIDAELFGHARGAFTGAVVDRAGLFESADGGTLFLDEVAELSPRAQAKLLRALQQQEVRRVGETACRRVDVRIVSAANRDLRTSVAAGHFRHDLLYRLDVLRICIPPLRERPEDIPVLARRLWEASAAKTGTQALLTDDVIDALQRHRWPGNVRELQNVMAALAVAAPAAGLADVCHLPAWLRPGPAAVVPLAGARAAFERARVIDALARAGGNQAQAAHALGISRQGLAKMCARLGVVGRSAALHAATVHERRGGDACQEAFDEACDEARDEAGDEARDEA